MQESIGGGLRGGVSLWVVIISSNKGVKAFFSWVNMNGMEVSFKKALSLM
jgi:hypothetical protein